MLLRIALLFLASCILEAKPAVLFILGRAGSPELEQEIEHCRTELGRWYETHRNAEVRICRTLDEVKTEFTRLAEEKDRESVDLFLFGHGSANGRRVTLSMRGGRLTASALNELLRKRSCETVFLFNTMSAPFLDALRAPGRILVSATDSDRQLNPPRYPFYFLQALKDLGPGKALPEYLTRAGDLTRQFYESHKLAITENSQYFNGKEKLSHPFTSRPRTVAVSPAGSGNAEKPRTAARPPRPSGKRTLHPATEETKQRIAEARKLAERYRVYPAFYTKRDITAVLNGDKTAQIRIGDAIYFRTSAGSERFAPTRNETAVPARLIHPDGTFLLIERGPIPTPQPGSLLEITSSRTLQTTGHLPEFHAVISLQTSLPVAAHTFRASGATELYRIKTYHLTTPELPPLIPERSAVRETPRIVITTLPSWTEFLAWARRMTDRAMTLDNDAERFTDRLLKGAGTDREKIRRIYDFLNGLRYVTIPLGAAAFRPQSTGDVIRNRYGDCKDKASALVAMCARAGIRAERVLVRRGGSIDPEFPSWQFNHMIVYLPSLDLWLDATDGLTPFGDLPPGDHGTLGLSLDAPGVRFRTVKTAQDAGRFERTIRRNGSRIEIRTSCTGLFDYAFRSRLKRLLPETETNFFASVLESVLPAAELENVTVSAGDACGKSEFTLFANLSGDAKESLPAPDLPTELLRPFSARRILSPCRVFDGRDWEFRLRVECAGRKSSLKRETEHVRLRLDSDGRTVEAVVSGRGAAAIAPEEYAAIRKALNELRISLRAAANGGSGK